MIQKKKMLVITKQYGDYTGATVSTQKIIQKASEVYDVTVVTLRKSNYLNIENVHIKVLQNVFSIVKFANNFSKNNSDVVGYSDDHLGIIFKLIHISYIHTYHGNWPQVRWVSLSFFMKSFIFIPLYKATIRNADYLVNVSNYMGVSFSNKYNKKNKVIYNGVNHVGENKPSIANKSRFIMVGNVDKRKYGNLINILNKSKKENWQIEIDIYGKIINEKISKQLNEFRNISLLGNVSQIEFNQYKALICTSKSENLPLSIVEGLESGIPVVSFDTGGISEVVDCTNGILIEQNDIQRFYETLINFDEKNFKVDSMKIKNIFDWQFASNEYLKLFEMV